MPIDLDALEAQQSPQETARGIDLDALESQPAATQGQGIILTGDETTVPAEGDKHTFASVIEDVWEQGIKGPVLDFAQGAGQMSQGGLLTGPAATMEAANIFADNAPIVKKLPLVSPTLAVWEKSAEFLRIADEWAAKQGIFVPPRENRGFWGDVYSGIGQSTGFMAGGALAKTAELPAWIAAGSLGALQEAGMMQMEAEEANASPEHQALNTIGGLVTGFSEAGPAGYLLNKLNKATGGKLWDGLKAVGGVNAEPGMLRTIVESALSEAGQEGAQTVAENAIVQQTYNPEKELGDQFWHSVLVGGTAGALMGGGMYPFIKRQQAKVIDQNEAQRNLLLSMGLPINFIEGEMMPLEDRLQVMERWNTLDAEVMLKEEAALDEWLKNGEAGILFDSPQYPNELGPTGVITTNQKLWYRGQLESDPGVSRDLAEGVDPKNSVGVDSTLAGSDISSVLKDTEAPVVVAALKREQAEIKSLSQSIHNRIGDMQRYQAVLAQNPQDFTATAAIKSAKADIDLFRRQRSRYVRRLALGNKLMREAGKMIVQLSSIFDRPQHDIPLDINGDPIWNPTDPKDANFGMILPETKTRYVLREEQIQGKNGGKILGSMGRIANFLNNAGEAQEVGVMTLDLDAVIDKAYPKILSDLPGTKEENQVEIRRLFSTLVHEFGHSYATKHVQDLRRAFDKVELLMKQNSAIQGNTFAESRQKQNAKPDFVTEEDWAKAKTFLAFALDYRQFMIRARNKQMPFLKFLTQQHGIDVVDDFVSMNYGTDFSRVDMSIVRDPNYTYSFDEYMAHRFERMIAKARSVGGMTFDADSKLDPLLEKNLFKPVMEKYKEVFNNLARQEPLVRDALLSPEYNTPHAFETFMDRMVVQRALDMQMQRLVEQGPLNLIDVLKKKVPGFEAEGWAGLAENYDKFTKFHAIFFNLTQIAEENPQIMALQKYFNAIALNWAPYARRIYDRANNTLHDWRKLGKESGNKITNILLEESEQEEEFTPQELSRKLTEKEMAVYYTIRKDLNYVLSEMERVSIQQAQETYYDNEEQLEKALTEITEVFTGMRNKGYFPYIRFGKYILEVRANKDTMVDGKKFKKDQLISWESFDTKYGRSKQKQDWGTRNGDLRYGEKEQTDSSYSIQGLPRPIMLALKSRLEASGAEPETLRVLNEAINKSLPVHSFKRHFLRKRRIKGFSMDFQRSYMAYMRMSAGHLSRIENEPLMTGAIKLLADDIENITFYGGNANARSRLLNWMQEHYNYIMNPGNELQALRSLGFFWFLGFSVKSGAVNLFQIVTTGLPYMQGRFGDLNGTKWLMKAQKDVVDYWRNREDWIFDSLAGERLLLATATKAGPLSPLGNLFQLGQVQFVHPQGTKFWDLSAVDLVNTNDPAVRQKLLETALEQEQREIQPDVARLTKLNAALTGLVGPVSVSDFIDLRLEETVKSMGMHGAVLEDGRTSVVFVGESLGKVKEISQKEFKRRQQSGAQNLRRGELVRMVQRGQAEGWLDQSLAMETAIAASENRADRLAPLNMLEIGWYKLSQWGAMPFHVTEKLNRQIVSMAAYNAAREEGLSETRSVAEARHAVYKSMYEHANWNRAAILRGKKSALFLFMNYVQNTAYFATRGDKAALRHWLIMGLLAGAVGLPFAQDAEDLIDFAVTRLNEMLGIKSPKFQLRQEARKLLSEMNMNPDLILHGFGQTAFGAAYLSRLTGIPFPEIDLSGSIGLGNVIPGTGVPEAFVERGFDASLRQAVAEVGGAAGKASVDAFSAMLSSDPNEWKKLEKILPVAARNVSKAARYVAEGEEYTAAGDVVAKFDPFDPRATMEVGAQAFGFTPARVTRGWERILAERELVEYYRRRQSEVTKNYAHAVYIQDRENQADAWRQVKEYNAVVPFPEMKIKGDSLTQSVREYITSQIEHKVGKVEAKNYRLTKSLEETYKIPADVGTLGSD